MKTEVTTKIKTCTESNCLLVDKVLIDEEEYKLEITNVGHSLFLSFIRGECLVYRILIKDGYIQLRRLIRRPTHDHDDTETLADVIDKEAVFRQLDWNEKDKALKIPFGMRIDKY